MDWRPLHRRRRGRAVRGEGLGTRGHHSQSLWLPGDESLAEKRAGRGDARVLPGSEPQGLDGKGHMRQLAPEARKSIRA